MRKLRNSRKSRIDLEGWSIGALVVAVAAYRFGGTIVDHDLWGRLRFGIDRVAAGRYIYEDPYSYLTGGVTRYEHDWLASNAMAVIYQQIGPVGLVVAKAVLALGLVGLMSWWLLRSGLRPTRMAFVMLAAIIGLTPTLSTFRPQVLTTLLFAAVLLIIVEVHEGRQRLVWLIPPLFVLWVNLHGGVLAGVGVVGLWALLYVLTVKGSSRWTPLSAWGLGVIGLGINPLGYDHIRFLIETTTVDRPEILDWLPIDLTSPQGVAYLVLAGTSLLLLWVRRNEIVLPIWVPLAGLLVAPVVATRHLQLFVPAVVVFGGWIWSGENETSEEIEVEPADGGHRVAWLAIASLSAASAFGWVGYQSSCLAIEADQAAFPARAVSAIPPLTVGNAVVPFNWGEYVIWWRGTDLQVSTDGRRETVYSEEVHQMNLDFVNASGEDWNRLLSAGPTDLVLLPTLAPSADLMTDYPGWELGYQDAYASIFLPSGSPVSLSPDESLPIDSDGLCFPETTP